MLTELNSPKCGIGAKKAAQMRRGSAVFLAERHRHADVVKLLSDYNAASDAAESAAAPAAPPPAPEAEAEADGPAAGT